MIDLLVRDARIVDGTSNPWYQGDLAVEGGKIAAIGRLGAAQAHCVLDAEGMAVAADKVVTVAIDTVLTPELKAEGLAREVVRRIQAQRKNDDFNIEDRITTWYVVDSDLAEVFATWGKYIQAETLTTELVAGEPPAEAFVEKHKVEGAEVTIGVKQN